MPTAGAFSRRSHLFYVSGAAATLVVLGTAAFGIATSSQVRDLRAAIRALEARQALQADRPGHVERSLAATGTGRGPARIAGDLEVAGSIVADAIQTKGGLKVGLNTLSVFNDVDFPPGPLHADLILSDITALGAGRIGLARTDLADFSGVQVGIGFGNPQHHLHVHNGQLNGFGFVPRAVDVALTAR